MNHWPISYYTVSLSDKDGQLLQLHYFKTGREAIAFAHSLLGHNDRFVQIERHHNYLFDSDLEVSDQPRYYMTDCGLDVVYPQDSR